MLKGIVTCAECGGTVNKRNCAYRRADGERMDMWYYACCGDPAAKRARRCAAAAALMVRMEAVNRMVHALMVKLGTEPVTERRLVPGTTGRTRSG